MADDVRKAYKIFAFSRCYCFVLAPVLLLQQALSDLLADMKRGVEGIGSAVRSNRQALYQGSELRKKNENKKQRNSSKKIVSCRRLGHATTKTIKTEEKKSDHKFPYGYILMSTR